MRVTGRRYSRVRRAKVQVKMVKLMRVGEPPEDCCVGRVAERPRVRRVMPNYVRKGLV